MRLKPPHECRADPSAQKEEEHIDAEQRSRRSLVDAGVGTAIYQEEAVNSRLSAIVEELCDHSPAQMTDAQNREVNELGMWNFRLGSPGCLPPPHGLHLIGSLGQTREDEDTRRQDKDTA